MIDIADSMLSAEYGRYPRIETKVPYSNKSDQGKRTDREGIQ